MNEDTSKPVETAQATETPEIASGDDQADADSSDSGSSSKSEAKQTSNLPVPYAAQPDASKPGWIARLIGIITGQASRGSARAELEEVLADSYDGDQTLTVTEKALLTNILRLRELRIDDVMIPRGDIKAVDLRNSLAEILLLFESSGHSRMPVYDDTLDDPKGMIHIRDVLGYISNKSTTKKSRRKADAGALKLDLSKTDLSITLEKSALTRPVLFVPPSMLAIDLMAHMQGARIQMALVIDEYGGTDGLVSLEDVVETVFGDIEDEHDDAAESLIEEISTGIYLADAKAELEDVTRVIGADFDMAEHEDEVDTLGGLLFSSIGRIPARGEIIHAIDGFEIQVEDADPRRIKKIRIIRKKSGARRKVR